tara:strand:+ start:10534 stop:11196 length:663 start_codon:yes stop_codon:yes gene_type:complete
VRCFAFSDLTPLQLVSRYIEKASGIQSTDLSMARRARSGMTLIEVLAAAVLVSLLMAGLCGILTGLHRQRVALSTLATPEAWRYRLQQQIEWDFKNARRLHVRSNQLTLVGYGSRDFRSGMPTQRPSEVAYFLVPVNGERWLVRRESHLDELTNRNSQITVLASGISEIRVGRPEESINDYVPTLPGIDLSPVPAKVRCVMLKEDDTLATDVTIIRGVTW